FDCLMFPNRDRLQKYADAGLVDPEGDEAALVGFPKVDCLVDGSLDRSSIQQSLGLDPSLPTVLYAPTWSPYSSLHSHGFDIVDCPKLVEMAQISAEKVRLLRSAAVVVRDGAETARAVADGLTRPAHLSARRCEIAAQLFYCAGTATERAVAWMYRLLAMPAPS